MNFRIGFIVEGHGDTEALPVLWRRICNAIQPGVSFQVAGKFRLPKQKLLKQGELERAMELLRWKVGRRGAILVLLDSDDDCPVTLGKILLARANAVSGGMPLGLVLAQREFEAWFLAGAASLAGKRRLRSALVAPSAPEEIRGAKEWLSQHMEEGHSYRETIDQSALSAIVDLNLARRAKSFDKLWREVERLLEILGKTNDLDAAPA